MRFAIHGPMFSGKSSLARELRNAYGFTYLNYTDWGKSLVATSLAALLGRPMSESEVIARKNEPAMRDFTIAALRFYGFDEGRGVALLASRLEPGERAVFDNVRYLPQFLALKPYDFTLVRLVLDPITQARRAEAAGMPYTTLLQLRAESSEQPLPEQPGEIRLNVGGYTVAELAHAVQLRHAALQPH